MRRFWDRATFEACGAGFTVRLDGRPMRLPGGGRLEVPQRALAEAIAAEWQLAGGRQGGDFTPNDVPLTQLAGTAQERIAPDPAPVVDALARYGETDLLCYRAEAPEKLVRLQARHWQPWLDWAARDLDAPLNVTSGVMHIAQNADALAALRRTLAALDPPALAALGVAVPALGSLVLGLALAAGRLDATEAHRLSVLDELFQEELWGEDATAVARRAQVAAEVVLAVRYLRLSRGEEA